MKLILDTNIILSALIRDSSTREIIKKSGWDFYYPNMSFHEIRKYKNIVLKKARLPEREYGCILDMLFEEITLIPDEQILLYLDEAQRIMQKIDPDDVVFIAASLSQKKAIVWTDDTDFDRQIVIKTIKTKDAVKIFTDSSNSVG